MCVDSCLVEGVKRGDHQAFTTIVKKYRPLLLKFCYRLTKDMQASEDIVQDSFVKTYNKIDSFEGRSSFKNWLFKITVNTLRNKMRKTSRSFLSLDRLSFISTEAKSEANLLNKQLQVLILSEVSQLPDKQKKALTLRIYDNMSFKEISQIMDCPYDTAKANYRHGLLKLRKRFETAQELKNYKLFFIESFKKVIPKFELN